MLCQALVGSVRIVVGSRGVALSYRTGERNVSLRIEFAWTPCRFSGLRAWLGVSTFPCLNVLIRFLIMASVGLNAALAARAHQRDATTKAFIS